MKNYQHDNRVVMTLDAGGNSFRFSAILGNEILIEPAICLPSYAEDLEKCLASLEEGFTKVKAELDKRGMKPVAISFAFPGPADYPRGIISGDLPNFPAFKNLGGLAMGDFLQDLFHLPVFINNDGDLFAYGEALAGILPEVNAKLEHAKSIKSYRNLLGLTFGTGFGAGIVINGELLMGDNSCSAEIFANRNMKYPDYIVEESVSIRGVQLAYAKYTGGKKYSSELTPKDICDIADGTKEGNQVAARLAFEEFGQIAGDTIANVITMIDGLIVIGGGLAGAHKHYMSALLKQLNSTIRRTENNGTMSRIPQKVYNMDDEQEFALMAKGSQSTIAVPRSTRTVSYDSERRIGVAISKLGASKAIMLGAYAYALNEIDK